MIATRARGFASLSRVVLVLCTLIVALGSGLGALADQTPVEGTPIAAPCLDLLEEATPSASHDEHGGEVASLPAMQGTPSTGGVDGMTGTASPAATPAATPSAALPPFDLAFIDLMLPHHEGAIAMGEVALARAEHQELRDMAQQIIDSQRARQAQLSSWRGAWFGEVPQLDTPVALSVFDAAMAELGMSADSGNLHGVDPNAGAHDLCRAGPPFDLAFIDAMIRHHQGALTMAEVALQVAVHPEVRSFAERVIDIQNAEIDQMLIWQEQWS
ncbi:MAG: DUF305 domain-containing protein [Chloroflexota bacterium]|nr:DUF305 domain-containing protein [Chloroflexota bacterium]